MPEENEEVLFKSVRYYIIGSLDEKVKKLLLDGKAKEEKYLSGLATHAIVTDYTNVEVEYAKEECQIPTVTPAWVELSRKCNKLLSPDAFTPSNSLLFSGLVFCPSQLVKSDCDILWAIVTFHGGDCRLTLDNKCTHLVVPKPIGEKYEKAIKHPNDITVVTPDWITDCVESKLLQDARMYHPNLVILPREKLIEDIPSSAETQNNTQGESSDIIASSLQNLAVSAAEPAQPVVSQPPATAQVNENKVSEVVTNVMNLSIQSTSVTCASTGEKTPVIPATGITSSSVPMHMAVTPSAAVIQQNKNQFQATGQTIISQPGQQQLMMQPQMHQFQQIQRPGTARFSVPTLPQRFSSPNQGSPARQNSQTPKKPASKRRRSSSSRSKNATTAVASSPVHGNQMGNVMMSPQQLQNNMLQPNQQQMMNQQRMVLMQGGQTGTANFMQQQMVQQQYVARMQGKGQAAQTSPQKILGQHVMGDQSTAVVGMRPSFPVNFPSPAMRMQQHQPRPIQNQMQLSPQQMMAMGFNTQMQVQQQQQGKLPAAGMQQQQQFNQQQTGVGMSMNQQQAAVRMQQPQRMQVSPQQQAMFIQQHSLEQPGGNVSPRQAMQQHSPMGQQQLVQTQQLQGGMTQQQRQPQQIVMQQMIMQQQQQMQLQHQQQLMQSPSNIQTAQKNSIPSSQASVNVGIDVISPTALQQGLMLAQAQQNQAFQQPLIHPSLQAPPQEFVAQQGGGSKSRRSKSRRTKDGDENTETKPKSRSRGGRQKKSSQNTASSVASPVTKKLNSPSAGSLAPRNSFSPMIRANAPMGFYPSTMNVMTPPPHPTVPVAFSSNKQFPSPPATVSPLAATENTYGASHLMSSGNRIMPTQPQPTVTKVKTHFLAQHTPTPTPPPPHRGPFNDPLNVVPKSYEGCYFGHDPAENVPPNLCLLGCVFVILEYQENITDGKIIENWKKIISRYGGIVEDEYNTCTCTHLLCISQTTSLFKDSLLEGKRCVTASWLNDVLQIRELRPPWLALHVPTPYPPTQKPAAKHIMCYTGFHQKERERLKMMAHVCGSKFTGFLSRSNTVLICKGTLSLKYDKAREWRIPCVNVHWLRDVVQGDEEALNNPNQAKYQNFDENAADIFNLDETKMQQILDPWKVPVRVTLDCMQRARVKRKSSNSDTTVSTPSLKRSRMEGSYQALPRVCFTGLPASQVTELQKKLELLQGQVSDTVNHSTHLVAQCISRTVKFLCAVSVCQYIVTPEWIEESSKSNWLLDEDKYLLHDKNAEENFQFSLKESMSRARKNQLFKGYKFCVTENVSPNRETLSQIVECAGGKIMANIPPVSVLKRLKQRMPPNNRVLLISCPADEQQVIRWKSEGIPVHNAEIILTGVLKQEINESLYQL